MGPYSRFIASGIILGFAQGLGEIVRACSLTCNVGFRALPLAFLAISFSSVLFVTVRQRLLQRWGARRWRTGSVLAAAGSLLLFRLAAYIVVQAQWNHAARWIYLAFYVWFAIIFTALVSDLLGRAGRAFEGSLAARAILYVSSAILLGGLLGSWSTGMINSWLERLIGGRFEIIRDHIMIAMALILLCDILWVAAPEDGGGPASQARPPLDLMMGWAWIKSDRAVASLALLCFAGGCAAIVSDYLFYWLISEQVRSSSGFVSYFSTFYIWLNGFSLFIIIFGVERIVKKVGLAVALALLPVSLFMGAAYLLFHLSVLVMYVFRIVEEGLWSSLYDPAKENLVLGTDPNRYEALRSLLDAVVYRSGQAAAAIVVLILSSVFKIALSTMVGLLLLIYLLWIWTVVNAARRAQRLIPPEPMIN